MISERRSEGKRRLCLGCRDCGDKWYEVLKYKVWLKSQWSQQEELDESSCDGMILVADNFEKKKNKL